MRVWFVLLFIFSLFFQVIGFISILVSFLLYSLLRKYKTNLKENDLFKNKHTEGNLFHQLDEYEHLTTQDINSIRDINTYKDVLYHGSEEEKIEFIGMTVYNPNKEFVVLLRLALNDTSETIRILSSSSLQKMEDIFEKRIIKIEEKIKNENDKSKKNHLYLDLIMVYNDLIDSTLVEKILQSSYVDYIFEAFSKIEDIKNDKKIYDLYLSLNIKYNKLNELEEILEEEVKLKEEIIYQFLLLELYYKKNDFIKLEILLKNIDMHKIYNIKYLNSYNYWMEYVK
jgi:hypothetical protein